MKIAVVIPAYRVADRLLGVLERIPAQVERAYVIDDRCPLGSGRAVEQQCRDPRVRVIYQERNEGVGGATMRGYRAALEDGAEIIVKLDGDGQMDPGAIPLLVDPIVQGRADFTKGNRFYSLDLLTGMPPVRLLGNSILSFVSKMSSGYWHLMDPTNGFTAVHANVLRVLPLHKIEKRYFFESDMLFRLNTVRAVVYELPMKAVYGDQESALSVVGTALSFPGKYLQRFFKRIFYSYFLRDFNVCSLKILFGIAFLAFGSLFGGYHWYVSHTQGVPATAGTVILAALPVVLGFELLLSAVSFDITNVPREPIHRYLAPEEI